MLNLRDLPQEKQDTGLYWIIITLVCDYEEKWKIYMYIMTFRNPHDSIIEWGVNNITV